MLTLALSWRGPNQWPYAWLEGVRRPTFTPAIKHVLLDSPLLWLLLLKYTRLCSSYSSYCCGHLKSSLALARV